VNGILVSTSEDEITRVEDKRRRDMAAAGFTKSGPANQARGIDERPVQDSL